MTRFLRTLLNCRCYHTILVHLLCYNTIPETGLVNATEMCFLWLWWLSVQKQSTCWSVIWLEVGLGFKTVPFLSIFWKWRLCILVWWKAGGRASHALGTCHLWGLWAHSQSRSRPDIGTLRGTSPFTWPWNHNAWIAAEAHSNHTTHCSSTSLYTLHALSSLLRTAHTKACWWHFRCQSLLQGSQSTRILPLSS